MVETLRDWLDGEQDEPHGTRTWHPRHRATTRERISSDLVDEPSRRRPWLLVAGLAPWVVLAAVLLHGVGAAPAGPVPGDPVATPPASASPQPVAPTVAAPVAALDEAGAVAALAVRDAVSQPDGGGRIRYVDLALPEAVVPHSATLAVVRVLAVVLEGRGNEWSSARTMRFGVPVRLGTPEPRLAGAPWPLPPPAGQPGTVKVVPEGGWTKVHETGVEADVRTALTAAGYAVTAVEEVSRSRAHADVLRARVRASPPGGEVEEMHEVWLRAGDPPLVLGS